MDPNNLAEGSLPLFEELVSGRDQKVSMSYYKKLLFQLK
jgi:hypothetical protein